jgi:AraC-like DNA-binding protein
VIFETYQPKPPLDAIVQSIIYYKDLTLPHQKERVIPTGHTFLLLAFDGYTREIYDESLRSITQLSEAWLSGPQKQTLNISVHPRSEMMAVQFTLGGARSILPQPLFHYAGKVKPAKEVFGTQISELHRELSELVGVQEKFQRVSDWLLYLHQKSLNAPIWLNTVLSRMQENPYSKHTDILQNLGYSQKHLIKVVKDYIGLTPKTLHRLIRFGSLLRRIQKEEKIRWAEVSYETGYADQAHFAKDFLRFSGFKPSQFLQDYKDYPAENFFPLE